MAKAKTLRPIRMDDETWTELQDLATPIQIERAANGVTLDEILRHIIDHYKRSNQTYGEYLKLEGLVRTTIPN